MHIHSVWYVVDGGGRDAVTPDDASPSAYPAAPRWVPVESGLLSLERSRRELPDVDARWTTTSEDFTVASFVINDPDLRRRMGGPVVGVASPSPSTNFAVAQRFRTSQSDPSTLVTLRPVAADLDAVVVRRGLQVTVAAVRYQDHGDQHLIDFAEPRTVQEDRPAVKLQPDNTLVGATIVLSGRVVNLFTDNQIYLHDILPWDVPAVVARLGTALWEGSGG